MAKKGLANLTHSTYWKKAVKKVANFNGKTILIITIGMLTIAVIVLYAVHSRQVDDKNRVDKEITQTELMLNEIQLEQKSAEKAALEQQLEEITVDRDTYDAILSQPIQSFDIITNLVNIASDHSVQINSITLADKTSAELGGIPCSVMSLEVGIAGDDEDLKDFVQALNSSFTTGLVESISINLLEMVGGQPSADMVLTIYSSEG